MTRKPRTTNRYKAACFGAAVVAALGVGVMANVDGAIFTTTWDGTVVNENTRYPDKAAVYLGGGPQNHNANGLPAGNYYFMITDPSGAVLLSTDAIECRELIVNSAGRIAGSVYTGSGADCKHANGTFNPGSGNTPVQMIPFNDTPNPGGEYKAWLTPVGNYDPNGTVCTSNNRFGFCDAFSKTDNFKVQQPDPLYADVTVCKFNDIDGNGTRNSGEPLIQHWPITASGVDGGTVNAQTLDDGCVTFTYSGFANSTSTQTVVLSEGTFGLDWTRTAPADDADGTDGITVAGGVISVVVKPGGAIVAPYFGNTNPFCGDHCNLNELLVTKTAKPSLKRTFTWDIKKSVNKTEILTTAGGDATFNYTVEVTHDAGTDSDRKVAGTITVSNPGGDAISGVDVTDAVDNGGSCEVTGGTGQTISGGSHVDFSYTCTYGSPPGDGINTAMATTAALGAFSGTASVIWANATVANVDGSVTVTDPLGGGLLGTVSSAGPSPTSFTYSNTVKAPSGTCNTIDNTATYKSDTSETQGSSSQTVRVCGGANLTVSKTAAADFSSDITKAVDKTLVEQQGGTATFNYTVKATTSGWTVSGAITVTNPNDWESIAGNVVDSLTDAGGICTGGTFNIAQSGSAVVNYSCSFASAPTGVSGTNTATATWDSAAAHTSNGSASGTAGYDFGSSNVVDTFNVTATTLGSVAGNVASKTFTYAHTVSNGVGGRCTKYDNTATFRGESASQSVNICNTATGALTIGFWQNKNGQDMINTGASTAGVCNAGTSLRTYAPFQDLSATATCAQVATYVTNIIKAANASGAAMNAMLKAQMLATALDVFFSSPAGGSKIAPANLGSVKINLTKVNKLIFSANYENTSAAWGGATALTVSQLLAYAASQSNSGGSIWYGQIKATQELAKDTFDAINNAVAWIAP